MKPHAQPNTNHWISVLQTFARPPVRAQHCELCATAMENDHGHLLEPSNGRILCCCETCLMRFSSQFETRLRRIPRRLRRLDRFRLSEASWSALHLPIELAYFCYHTPRQRVVARYPGPAGATESLLPLDSWSEIVGANPFLDDMLPDVEALLINRTGTQAVYYLLPIDYCHALSGLIRRHWHGVSGGNEVREAIETFFQGLQDETGSAGSWGHV